MREPIWIYEGQILDGRNRYRAASSQGVEFEVREYLGDDPVGFVVSLNLHRRHLTESQRAAVAAKLANIEPGQFVGNQHVPSANLPTPAVSQADAAKLLNVSTRSVTAAKKVIEEAAPELVQAMDEGRASVSAAASLLSLPKDEQAAVATGDKKTIQKAARQAKEHRVEIVRPSIPEHVLSVINAMDVLARFASRMRNNRGTGECCSDLGRRILHLFNRWEWTYFPERHDLRLVVVQRVVPEESVNLFPGRNAVHCAASAPSLTASTMALADSRA